MMALFVGAMLFQADAGATQAPVNPRWTLRADPALCALERQVTDPPLTLLVDTIPGSDNYRVVVVSSSVKKTTSLAPASLTFAPSQKRLKGLASVAKLPDGRKAIVMHGVEPALLNDLSSADAMTIVVGGENASVQTVGSTKAVEALRRCNADQLTEWGADAGQFTPGGTTPVSVKSRDEWLSNKQLLAIMGQSKRSDLDEMFRVAVSPEGVVDACSPLNDKIEKGVERSACSAVVGKSLFTAAKDASGRSVRGVATFQVRLVSRPAS